MEIHGSPIEGRNGRLMSTDFVEWEKLAAELPQAFSTPAAPRTAPGTSSGGNDEEVDKRTHY